MGRPGLHDGDADGAPVAGICEDRTESVGAELLVAHRFHNYTPAPFQVDDFDRLVDPIKDDGVPRAPRVERRVDLGQAEALLDQKLLRAPFALKHVADVDLRRFGHLFVDNELMRFRLLDGAEVVNGVHRGAPQALLGQLMASRAPCSGLGFLVGQASRQGQ